MAEYMHSKSPERNQDSLMGFFSFPEKRRDNNYMELCTHCLSIWEIISLLQVQFLPASFFLIESEVKKTK